MLKFPSTTRLPLAHSLSLSLYAPPDFLFEQKEKKTLPVEFHPPQKSSVHYLE